MAGTRRGVHACALVTAVLFGWVGPVAAAPAIEDLVVAPPGVQVVRAPDSEEEPPRTDSFLDSYDDLDAQVVDTDVALLRVGDVGSTSVVVTIVRLASPAQARRAFDAVHAPQPSVAWSEGPVDGVGTRWVDDGQYQLLERYRTVGSDLVVWAEMLPEERTGSSLLERAVEAHLAAYPPDRGGVPLVWIAAVTVALALAAVALVVLRRRRTPPPPAPRRGTPSASAPRVNW